MDLQIKDQFFVVGGAGSGLGKAIALALAAEGARVLAIARSLEKLEELSAESPLIEPYAADLTHPETVAKLNAYLGNKVVHGLLINAGGPPAKQTLETTLSDWDDAYKNLLRWKVDLLHHFVPGMIKLGYGRILFIESASVKQPLENLVLSNSIRVAVVNMAKTLSQEIAGSGVTLNVLAPGSHNTPAINRIYAKKSEQLNKPVEQVRQAAIAAMPLKQLGEATDFASLALWLLSPFSNFITGQTISVDGGTVKGIFG